MPATRAPRRPVGPLGLLAGAARERVAPAAALLVGAFAFMVLEPWHGATVLSLSEQHGLDAADLPALPLIVLGLVVARPRAGEARPGRRWRAWGRVLTACAVTLGVLLVAGTLFPRIGSPLVPAGGGTFNRSIQAVDGRRAEPVGRWTHLAVTYDGVTLRLYVDGVEASSRSTSGRIRKTSDPLWIGGNRPYGEYFDGVIDELRVYGRALGPSEVRVAMSTPIAGRHRGHSPGLVAAYAFDAGRGRTVTDSSGNHNDGLVRGARSTSAGRFGAGMRFDGSGELVRVPPSPSLDLRQAMTLMAWIKPRAVQPGWRTVVARQTDVYSLVAGGGRENVRLLNQLDRLRFGLVILLVGAIGLALARSGSFLSRARARWYVPVALFIAGSLVDIAFAPADTLIGPALLAIWCGATSSHRAERLVMYALAAAFAIATILSILDPATLPLPLDAAGTVRSAALGLMLVAAGLLGLRRGRRARPPGSGALVST